jgi:uncharacterized protein YndB with AHSA1/START domain
MSEPVIVRVTHRYNVPAAKAFDAWLTPAQAAQFLFATRTGNIIHCELEPEVGGTFTVTDRRPNADGDESFFEAQHRGTYVEIDRPSRIAFDLSVEPFAEKSTRVTIDVVTLGANLCEVVITHHLGFDATAKANADRTRQGWERMLGQLDKVLTTRPWGIGLKTPGSQRN